MEKISGKSKRLDIENINLIKKLIPYAFDGDKIDFELLKEALGDNVSTDNERYQLTWHGKANSRQISMEQTSGTLLPHEEQSVNWSNSNNLFIEGDNLEALKLLQKSYHGKVKMIYIDPPYNTGSEFIYPDKFKDNLDTYLKFTGQIGDEGFKTSTNTEMDGRFHTNWLNMMYPRIRLSRNLLRKDGVAFISIGEAELGNLIKVCDELFGPVNRIGVCSRVMKTGGNKGTYFSPNVDYILVYAKDINEVNGFRDEISEELINKVYTQVQQEGPRKGENYRIMGLYQGYLDKRANQRYFIKCPDGSHVLPPGETIPQEVAMGEQVTPVDGDGMWRWTYGRFKEELENDNVEFKKTNKSSLIDQDGNQAKWNIYTKIWLKDRMDEGKVPVNIFEKFENRHSSAELKELDIPFDFAKPTMLIKYLMKIVGVKGNDIVLDFFAGSCSTADAVLQYNKEAGSQCQFVCIQLPELLPENSNEFKLGYKTIADIGKERIRRVLKKIESQDGFKVFSLGSSNIKSWSPDVENLEASLFDSVENLRDGRTEDDILYEILLKSGLELSVPVEIREVNSKKIFSVGFGALLICLEENLSIDDVEKIGQLKEELKPSSVRVVFRDNGFSDDSVKVNAIQALKQFGIEDVKSV
ncbi:DNA methylase N-4/N-6 domain-containing protein [Halobacteriovorax sp. BALOs_7]|uniref:site-specific DNA-methyltransferase n=1 Tax=Halobacteriovorax sp. BALOs_7 TaxID=2109558 RepID=UPI000EA19578|nr:site-specific DNA-methyltransferase [Halobacteriovorax sp. BALOs_7]AYF43709.1 DNA methylase N-4/N-6 domain-containing protein [Halobacteriovorax sp. BALOs_7]